jgi:hypothetical protein
MLKSSSLCLHTSNLGTFWLKIEQFWPFEEISIFSNGGHLEYRIKNNSSPLKLLSQSQPTFAEMILRWSPFKIVSASRALPPRWPLQFSCVVIESNFDPGERLQAPVLPTMDS